MPDFFWTYVVFLCMAATSRSITGERIPLALTPEARTQLELTPEAVTRLEEARMEPAAVRSHWLLCSHLRRRCAASILPCSSDVRRAVP